jgi:hypothetical protein
MTSERPDLPPKVYLAGGLIGVGTSTFLLLVIDFFMSFFKLKGLDFIVLIAYTIGGLTAGYFVAIQADDRYEFVSVKTSMYALLMNVLVMLMHTAFLGALWAIMGYTTGGWIGGFLARRKKLI